MKKKIVLFFILISAFLLVGCSQFECNKPYIKKGYDCCLDIDNNKICDSDESLKKQDLTNQQLVVFNKTKKINVDGKIRASHILVESEKQALSIITKLDAVPLSGLETEFSRLAKTFSVGPSSVNGGHLGMFKKGDMVSEFENAAFKLGLGEYSKIPVKTQFGYHVILRTE